MVKKLRGSDSFLRKRYKLDNLKIKSQLHHRVSFHLRMDRNEESPNTESRVGDNVSRR